MKARLLKIIEEEIITYELLYEGVFKTFYSEDELNKYVIKNNIEIISREDIFSEDMEHLFIYKNNLKYINREEI